jgi:hypothetical protein
MPRKPRYLSHNINIQPPDGQPLNTPQSPWFPFIYGSKNGQGQNSNTDIHLPPSSCTVHHAGISLAHVVVLLLTTCHGCSSYIHIHSDAGESSNTKRRLFEDQHISRNVRQCVMPTGIQHDSSTDCLAPVTVSNRCQGLMPLDSSSPEPRIQHRKRKAPNLPQSDAHNSEGACAIQPRKRNRFNITRTNGQKNQNIVSNNRPCLESLRVSHDEGQWISFVPMTLHIFYKQG